MSTQLPAACAACDEHLISLAFDEPASVPAECVAHAETCTRCAAELAALRDTRALMGMPLEEPSEELDARILAALDEHLEARAPEPRGPALTVLPGGSSPQQETLPSAPRRGWRVPMAAAASLAVIAGGVLMLSEGTRLARQGVPEAAQADQQLAASVVKEEAAPPPPPAPVVQVEKELDRVVEEQKAAPSATAGGAAPPARTYGTRKDAGRGVKLRARQDEGAPAAAANVYEPPAEKSKGAPVGKLAQTEEKREVTAPTALEPDAPAPAPVRESVARKGSYAEAESLAFEDVAADSFAAPSAPSMPSGVGGLSTRSVPIARAETRTTVDHARLLSGADAAAARGEYGEAASLYARVAHDGDAPRKLVIRALEGQARALLALGRFEEAAAAAHRLSVMAPGATRLKEEIESARLRAADSDSE